MIDWDRVDTVLLDMDGTLLDLAFDNRFWLEYMPAEYARAAGVPLAEAERDLFARMAAVEGTIQWYCLDYWSGQLGFDVVGIKHRRRDEVRYRAGARAFLRAVGGSGRHRLLVTNAHRAVLDVKLAVTGLADDLDGIVSAHDYGHAKQDQRFWDALHRAQGFDPQRAVLIDDSVSVLRAARRWGVAQTVGIAQPDTTRAPEPADHGLPVIDGFDAVRPV